MITDLRLQNFRSYQDSSFDLSNKVNIIIGPNASGKTNLLEALAMLAGARSWRTKLYTDVINNNHPWSRIDAHTVNGERILKILAEPQSKIYEINGSTSKRLPRDKYLPTTLFEPNHLLMLASRPELRRDYVDGLAGQIYTEFNTIINKYKRVLSQRNNLLKNDRSVVSDQIFGWNIRLSELAGQVVGLRRELIDYINTRITGTYNNLTKGKYKVKLSYQSETPLESYESALLKKLETNIDKEIIRGHTLFGPHRDDIAFFLNGKPNAVVASRGEARTTILALKIIEAKLLEEKSGIKPLILLDDVFSELDGKRRLQLTKHLNGYQTFITTTDADIAIQHFSGRANIIPLT